MVLRRRDYRFQYSREEARFHTDPDGRRHAPSVDTIRFVSDAIDPYSVGIRVPDTTMRGEIVLECACLASLDLADPRFSRHTVSR